MSVPTPRPLRQGHFRLRPLQRGDAGNWSAYLSKPGVIEHTSWQDVGVASLAELIDSYGQDQGPWRWAIVDAQDKLLGTIGLNSVDGPRRQAELAYDLDPDSQGQGLMTEAARAVLAWAHADMGLQRIEAVVLDSNTRSIGVLQRVQMTQERLLKAHRHVHGIPRDFWLYASAAPCLSPRPRHA